ncbi:hypothetical protein MKW94_006854, partial [Papaver nudicaule]|nr:hypothetical protein [Papaver nudicaule]
MQPIIDFGKNTVISLFLQIWVLVISFNDYYVLGFCQNIRKLVNEAYIFRKPTVIHSRARARRFNEAKAKGRHSGFGKRKGTQEARLPTKVLWMRRMRARKIDKHMYHDKYLRVKGNVLKNKRVLMESIHRSKVEIAREKTLSDQFEAKGTKKKASRERKHARREEHLAA